jgi:hypothetical protein
VIVLCLEAQWASQAPLVIQKALMLTMLCSENLAAECHETVTDEDQGEDRRVDLRATMDFGFQERSQCPSLVGDGISCVFRGQKRQQQNHADLLVCVRWQNRECSVCSEFPDFTIGCLTLLSVSYLVDREDHLLGGAPARLTFPDVVRLPGKSCPEQVPQTIPGSHVAQRRT